jgi:hypothetical protein
MPEAIVVAPRRGMQAARSLRATAAGSATIELVCARSFNTGEKQSGQEHADEVLVSTSMDKKARIFAMSFGSVYPLYVQKAAKKGRTKEEVDEIITWLTGYSSDQLQRAIAAKVDLEAFFAQAPRMNPNAGLITGVVCGVRVEDVADPLMQKIRYLDKLIDELAKGKKMVSILRQ